MAAHLLIDGYNLLKRGGAFLSGPAGDLESARRMLLEELFAYKKGKKLRITVVFDAPHGTSLSRTREGFRGIEVIYSRHGESADVVIVEIIRKRQAGTAVVTSDRAVIDEAKRNGIPFITSDRLQSMMEGGGEEEYSEGSVVKKGNPHKAPKRLRRARKIFDKM
jgi:predicted RNA-binding protein with PIN domain